MPSEENVWDVVAAKLLSRIDFVPSLMASPVFADASRMYEPAFMLIDFSAAQKQASWQMRDVVTGTRALHNCSPEYKSIQLGRLHADV